MATGKVWRSPCPLNVTIDPRIPEGWITRWKRICQGAVNLGLADFTSVNGRSLRAFSHRLRKDSMLTLDAYCG